MTPEEMRAEIQRACDESHVRDSRVPGVVFDAALRLAHRLAFDLPAAHACGRSYEDLDGTVYECDMAKGHGGNRHQMTVEWTDAD